MVDTAASIFVGSTVAVAGSAAAIGIGFAAVGTFTAGIVRHWYFGIAAAAAAAADADAAADAAADAVAVVARLSLRSLLLP